MSMQSQSQSNHTCGINYNLILKSTWNAKTKTISKKKNMDVELILSYFKTYNKSYSNQDVVWHWLKDRYLTQGNRIESWEKELHIYSNLILANMPR